jgi:hypothetical protein
VGRSIVFAAVTCALHAPTNPAEHATTNNIAELTARALDTPEFRPDFAHFAITKVLHTPRLPPGIVRYSNRFNGTIED